MEVPRAKEEIINDPICIMKKKKKEAEGSERGDAGNEIRCPLKRHMTIGTDGNSDVTN